MGKRMLQEDEVLPRATEPPFFSALHAQNDTTNLSGYKLGESTEKNKALLLLSGKSSIGGTELSFFLGRNFINLGRNTLTR